jgi:hypothetical protein
VPALRYTHAGLGLPERHHDGHHARRLIDDLACSAAIIEVIQPTPYPQVAP